MRRRMRFQPSKGQSIFSGIVGIIFCCIGFFVVIPAAGLFGLLWTGIAVVITVNAFAMAAGKSKMGHYVIEDDTDIPPVESVEERLKQLQSLYDQRLITTEEYESKRQEILKDL